MTDNQKQMVKLFVQAYTLEGCGDCKTCPFRKSNGDCVLWDVERVLNANAPIEYEAIYDSVEEDD